MAVCTPISTPSPPFRGVGGFFDCSNPGGGEFWGPSCSGYVLFKVKNIPVIGAQPPSAWIRFERCCWDAVLVPRNQCPDARMFPSSASLKWESFQEIHLIPPFSSNQNHPEALVIRCSSLDWWEIYIYIELCTFQEFFCGWGNGITNMDTLNWSPSSQNWLILLYFFSTVSDMFEASKLGWCSQQPGGTWNQQGCFRPFTLRTTSVSAFGAGASLMSWKWRRHLASRPWGGPRVNGVNQHRCGMMWTGP